MNYRKIYIKVIMHAKNLMKNDNRPISRYCRKNFDMYFEFHHILPRSLYNQYSKNKHNLVCLTAKEHFICHKLLTKIYPCYQMYYALSKFMSNGSGGRCLTAKQYNDCRLAISKGHIDYKKKHPDKIIKRLSKANETRLEKIKKLKEFGLYDEYKNMIVSKVQSTRKKIFEGLSEEEKQVIHKRRSEQSAKIAKEFREQRLKKMDNQWERINRKIAKTKSEWSPEKRKEISDKISGIVKKRFREMTNDEYIDFCHKMTKVAIQRNTDRKWWNNGKENKFCKDCPGKDWVLGQIKHWRHK